MKITYLFGAGASRQALPIVKEIPQRVKDIIELLKSESYKLSDIEEYKDLKLNKSKAEIQKVLINDLEWLLVNSENHASIDTYAKKIFIKGQDKELVRLKAAFSVYLIIEQLLKNADKRYDSFYASLLNDNYYDFPSNLRILSWNYDSQFEKSFSEYTDQNDIQTNQSLLNVVTKYSHDKPKNSKFCLLKLNGTTNLLQDRGWRQYNYINKYEDHLSLEQLDTIIRNFAALRLANIRLFSGLSFAWERYGDPDKDIVLYAKNETQDTEVLVIIGYSFPYFNREIDREIIGNMSRLNKIYFQAPDADIIKERFLSIRNDMSNENLLSRYDVGQFLLPNEL